MTIKLDKVASALAALMISIASFVVVTDAQARERDDHNSSEEPRCEERPCAAFAPALGNPSGESA